ncbi:Glycosyltransferase family 25 (LPS biosynthesis protein) [Ruegeria sp. THAF57]|uniref:glycosyltransferase family 25 protein n=1 Tax=Ruegeria sp. THAF57 TaxID=2744555 RepID=UPI0015DDA2F6|nr:glycosyltransferase family 25 protein [Ruegeria sp. THAF57]CAD0183565.1 Glycosyltransferase family 25 (LPS biosynthesis protein) [Ruegeria sp. THAF57]
MLFGSDPRPSTGLGVFEGIVDRIIVLSLPEAQERRDRIPSHLAEFGITAFEWHDAFTPDHPAVQSLYEEQRIATFPPCFRCGMDDCDCPNNVLIPQQVANFASHLDIWRLTSRQDGRILVMEDDIVLHPWTRRVSRKLWQGIERGNIDFTPKSTTLLRLGWALSKDHGRFKRFRTSHKVRMSNPCYALTPGFAVNLINHFDRVETTSDVFLHDEVATSEDSLTIFPPVASDLSWSEGATDSYIHPKKNRLEYLKKHNRDTELAEFERRLKHHVQHVYQRAILCVGHPRTGTGFVAELCTKSGVEVGHEADGKDGISSWMFAVDAAENPWAADPVAQTRKALKWQFMIQTVRDPATAIPSIIRENAHAPASYEFRRSHILAETGIDLNGFETDIERAVASLCLWASIIRGQNPDYVFRIETGSEALIDFLSENGFEVHKDNLDIGPVNAEKLYKGKHHEKPQIDAEQWEMIGPQAQALLSEYCEEYGYNSPVGAT